jgi:simple sugar transport system ATP-binding protein
VLGIAGVAGNGQNDLAEALLGYRPARTGTVQVGGVDVTHKGIRERLRLGLAFIPEDRHELGLVRELSIAGNLVLDRAAEPGFSRLGVLHRHAIDGYARARMEALDIRAPGPDAMAGTLSGGNQQKVVLGRALARDPRVIVASEPTRGLDLGATADVRAALTACAARGAGILLISSDLEELMALSHRIAVLYRGRIAGALDGADFDAARIGLLMAGLAE